MNNHKNGHKKRWFYNGTRLKKLISIIMVTSLIINVNWLTLMAKAEGTLFAGYNSNIVRMDLSEWMLNGAALDSGVISFLDGAQDDTGMAITILDVSSIATSIDLGMLEVNFYTDTLATGDVSEEEIIKAEIAFSTTDSVFDANYTVSEDRSTGNLGATERLSSGASIPSGTRFIIIRLSSTQKGVTNTATFSNTYLSIDDSTSPVLSASYDNSWTSSSFEITINAEENDSGIKAIFDGTTYDELSTTSSYKYTVEDNGSRSFVAQDYAGNSSEIITVEITNIDKVSPTEAPNITLSNTSWSQTPVVLTLSDITLSAEGSPERRQFKLNDGTWNDYTSQYTIDIEGETTVTSHTVDEAGNTSEEKTAKAYVDTVAPSFDSNSYSAKLSGNTTVNASSTDVSSGILKTLWAEGDKAKEYFAEQGNVYTDTFDVSTGGVYTVYAKDNAGNETIATILVNTYPSIDNISSQVLDEDISKELTVQVSDDESDNGTLQVSATSSDTSIIPNPVCTNNGGNVTVTLAPMANKHGGPIQITVQVSDGDLTRSTNFDVTVNSINDLPIAADDSLITVDEDDSINIAVLSNDNDPDGDGFDINWVGNAAKGLVKIADDKKSITYTPNKDANGSDSFTYTINDGTGNSDTATVSIDVTEINDLPEAVVDSVKVEEDESTLIDVLQNDLDNDLATTSDEVLSIVSIEDPSIGSASIEDNKVRYNPPANWSGTVTFEYTIKDRDGEESSSQIIVEVSPYNDAPEIIGVNESYTMNEDEENYEVSFSVADVETPLENLMFQVTSSNTDLLINSDISIHGMDDSDPAMSIKCTPLKNQFGDTTITLKVSDGFKVTTKTFILHVSGVNDAPVAHNDTRLYVEDSSAVIDMDELVLNDTDIDNTDLFFDGVVDMPVNGVLVEEDSEQNLWRYTPPANYTGQEVFTYRVSDGIAQDVASVILKPESCNDAPVITLGSSNVYQCNEDVSSSSIYFTIADVETTFNKLIVTAGSSKEDIVSSSNIVITKGADGQCSLVVTPNANYNGALVITLSLSDGQTVVTEQFDFTVVAVDDAPEVLDDTMVIPEGGSATIAPLENDRDADDETLSIVSITQPTKGVASFSGNNVTYTVNSGQSGADTFTYSVTDGNSVIIGTINVTISNYLDEPIVQSIPNQYILEDHETGNIIFSAYDPDDGDSITMTAVSSNISLVKNNNIKLTDNGDDTYTINVIPELNKYGSTIITVTAKDQGGKSTSIEFKVTVYSVNDVPTAQDDTVSTNEDESVIVDMLANDSDDETPHDTLNIVAITQPSHGRVVQTTSGYTYIPEPDYHGSDTFTYTMTDTNVLVDGTVNITVVSVNDPPEAHNYWRELPNVVGESVTINVLRYARDDDGDTLFTHEIVNKPLYGDADINADGTITYTRTKEGAGVNGTDSFEYRIRDRADALASDVLYDTANVYIAVDFGPGHVNGDDVWVTKSEDCDDFYIDLRISNPSGNELEITTSTPTLGEVVEIDNVNKKIKFRPGANLFGSETISYTVSDSISSDTAYIHLTLHPVNDPPHFTVTPSDIVFDEDTIAGLDETTGEIIVKYDDVDVEHNFEDINFDVWVHTGTGEKIALVDESVEIIPMSDGAKLKITPVEDGYGSGHLTLTIYDGLAYTTHDMNFTVNPVNDAPNAPDLEKALWEDTSIDIELVNENSDVDGDSLTLLISPTDIPMHGVLVENGGEVTYTPDKDFVGTDRFNYTLSDGNGGQNTGTVILNVVDVNDDPVILGLDYYQKTLEDIPKTINFKTIDNEGSTISYTFQSSNDVLLPVDNISISNVGEDVTMVLTPALNKYGTTDVTINAFDGLVTTSKSFRFIVKSVNDKPVANDDELTISEDEVTIITPLINDSDVEDAELKIVSIGATSNGGKVVNNDDGTITYTPMKDFYGIDTFEYTVSDSHDGTDNAIIRITVEPVNDKPVAKDDKATTDEDVPVIIDLLSNDTDIEGQSLSIISIGDGLLSQKIVNNGDGTVTYTPRENANGEDTFTYTISDGQSVNNTDTATVKVDIKVINDPPDAKKSAAYAGEWVFDEDTTGNFGFDVWDVETASKYLLVTMTSSAQWLIPDTSISLSGTYDEKMLALTPSPNKHGECVITVTISDGVNTTVRNFDVRVVSVNDQPTVSEPQKTTDEDTDIYDIALGSDVETVNDELIFTHDTTQVGPEHGAVTVDVDGNWHYSPDENYNGPDRFTIKIDDGSGEPDATNSVEVIININAVNDVPVANNDTKSTDEDVSVLIDVLANDTDVDKIVSLNKDPNYNPATEILTIKAGSFTGLTNGLATVESGKVRYTPNTNWTGTEIFDYIVVDPAGGEHSASITVTVSPVNDAPTVDVNTGMTLDEGATKDITNSMLEEGDPDDSGTSIIYTITVPTSNGVIKKSGVTLGINDTFTQAYIDNSSISYVHNGSETITDVFAFTVSDGGEDGAGTESGTFDITINPVNDAPVISEISNQTINEDASTGAISFIVTDVDDDNVDLVVTATSANSVLVVPNDNIEFVKGDGTNRTITITPIANKNGVTSIAVKVSDGDKYDTTTFVLTVNPLDDAPDAQNDEYTLNENSGATLIDVTANDDVDFIMEGDVLSIESIDSHTPNIGAVIIAQDSSDGNRDKIQFTPNSNWTNKTDEVVVIGYTMKDKNDDQSSAELRVTIEPVNDNPTITSIDDQNIDEDTSTNALAFTVADEEDVADTLTILKSSSNTEIVSNDGIVINHLSNGDYEVTVTPLPDANGSVDITLTVKDEDLAESVVTFTVNIAPVNDLPNGGNDDKVVVEDTVTVFDDLLYNDDIDIITNPDIENLTITGVTCPSHGTAVISSDGKVITYTPDANYFGGDDINDVSYDDDTFDYTMVNAHNEIGTFTVSIEITPVNDAPVITSTIATQHINEGIPTEVLSFSVSDVDDDDQSLIVTATSSKTFLIPNNNIDITKQTGGERTVQASPNGKWNGIADITLKVQDDDGLWSDDSIASFNVVIHSVNEDPVANDDTFNINEDTPANLAVLENDTDGDLTTNPDVETMTITSLNLVDADKCTVTIIDSGNKLRIVPKDDWNGVEEFEYTIEDSEGATSKASVTVKIKPINDAPVADDETAVTDEDTPVTIHVLDGDTDIDQDAGLNEYPGYDFSKQGFSIKTNGFTGVDNGSVSIVGNDVKFTPNTNWNGVEIFSYTVIDEFGGEGTGEVTVTVNAINDAPLVGVNTGMTLDEGTNKNITKSMLEEGDPDDAGTGVVYTINTKPVNGVLKLGSTILDINGTFTQADINTGEISYYHNGSETLTDNFDFTLTDGGEDSVGTASGTFTITINPINDPPILVKNFTLHIDEGASSQISNSYLLHDDVDNTTDELVYKLTDNVTNGELMLDATKLEENDTFKQSDIDNAKISYTHNGSETIADSFKFVLSDGSVSLAKKTFNISLLPINDEPTIGINSGLTVDEGDFGIVTKEMLNESDPDDEGLGVQYKITDLVDNGTLLINGGLVTVGTIIAQQYIDQGLLMYQHDGGETTSDSFSFELADGGEDGVGVALGTFDITILPINDPPELENKNTVTLDEGTVETISNTYFKHTDVDNANDELVYTLTKNVVNGELLLSGTKINVSDTFTQEDINNGNVGYSHNGDETTSDSFKYTLGDGTVTLDEDTFNLNILPVNDAPVVAINTGMQVEEGKEKTITNLMLREGDIDDEGDGVTYALKNLPQNGILKLEGTELGLDDTFTQGDIDGGKLSYLHNGSETIVDNFSFELADGGENGVGVATDTFTIIIIPLNDPPVLENNNTVTLGEGTTTQISNTDFKHTDVDNTNDELVYTLTENVVNGGILLSGIKINVGDAFTQKDIDDGSVSYIHNGDETIKDSFKYTLGDGTVMLDEDTFQFTITPINDAPIVGINTGMQVEEGDERTITNSMLEEGDPDDEGDGVSYTLTILPQNGVLKLDGTELGIDDTFTQADIDNGRITYLHDGSETVSDNFSFDITDGGENEVTAGNGTFNITIIPANDLPTPVDVLTPVNGDYFKDSQTIHVTWTESSDADGDDVVYKLEFFDGTAWTTLSEDIAVSEYDHVLGTTGLHTNKAKYRVTAYDSKEYSLSSDSDEFIIDNNAPIEVAVSLQDSNGDDIIEGNWIRSANFAVSGGNDLLDIRYFISIDSGAPFEATSGSINTFAEDGEHSVTISATDLLGNTAIVKRITFKIDTKAPLVPDISFAPEDYTSGIVNINFGLHQDPGGSGNYRLILPNGSELPAQDNMRWQAGSNGTYRFTLFDVAGNKREFDVTVDWIDQSIPRITCQSDGYNFDTWSNTAISAELFYHDSDSDIRLRRYSINQNASDAGEFEDYNGELNLLEEGIFYIHGFTQDSAGNEVEESFGQFMIDMTSPVLEAELIDETTNEFRVTSSDELSGMQSIVLSDGSQLSLSGVQSWTPQGFGEYQITATDLAGNTTTITVAVPELVVVEPEPTPVPTPEVEVELDDEKGTATVYIKKSNLGDDIDKVQLPSGEWVDLEEITLEEVPYGPITLNVMDKDGNIKEIVINVGNEAYAPPENNNYSQWWLMLLLGLGIGILIILLLYWNIRVILHIRNSDGSIKKKSYRKLSLRRKNNKKPLEILIKSQGDICPYLTEIVLSRWLTLRMREKSIHLTLKDMFEEIILVPEDADGKFKHSIEK